MYNSLVGFLGTPPAGMEPIVYLFAMFATVFFLDMFAGFIFTAFRSARR